MVYFWMKWGIFLNLDKFYDNFRQKCREIKPFSKDNYGKGLFICFVITMILIFFAPLFQSENVGTALISCVIVPYIVLLWRQYDKRHVIVPAVFFSLAMIVATLIYVIADFKAKGGVAAYYLVAVILTMLCAAGRVINFYDRIKDPLKMYLCAGAICAVIVIIACFISFVVSRTWWIICLVAFIAIIVFFFVVVIASTAYTATDGKRQARKKYIEEQQNYNRDTYEAVKIRRVEDITFDDLNDEDDANDFSELMDKYNL